MNFKEFSTYLQKLENTASRNDATEILAEMFKDLDNTEIRYALYFIQGRLAPKFIDLEFNVSRKVIFSALEELTDKKEVNKVFKETGDAGLVVEHIIEKIKNGIPNQPEGLFVKEEITYEDQNLSLAQIFNKLKEIALFEGKGSVDFKKKAIVELFTSVDSLSGRYISRIIVGSLRLGLSDKTMLDAFSWFIRGDKSLRKDFDRAFGARADIGDLGELILESKDIVNDLNEIKIEIGTPVASKLVEREKDPKKVWERMPNCFVQPKLDGLRGQLHYSAEPIDMDSKLDSQSNHRDGKTETGDKGSSYSAQIYSRNMENMTTQFPELIKGLQKLNVKSIILDSEIIGVDQKTGEYLSYQETMQRKRKYDVEAFAKDIPVKAMCFDILYLNGEDISTQPIEYRIEKLQELVKGVDSLEMLETIQMQTEEELTDYFETSVADGLEGIITKEMESTYEPGSRNYSWIKLKANTKSELVDTIDVAVIGYYIGRGQRAKFGIGAFLTALYDPKEDKYYSFGKVGSGITDEVFKKIKNDIKDMEIEEKPEDVDVEKPLYPDVWLRPSIIIEIDADEITRSPSHSAAKNIKANVPKDDSTRGLSVRFPRLKVWNRDKEYPNTVDEIIKMYELRKGAK